MRLSIALCFVFFAAQAGAGPRTDSCSKSVPQSLASAAKLAFPGYRMPREIDNLPEDIKYNRRHGGSGCLGVAAADLNGDSRRDYVLGLAAKTGAEGLAVIALSDKEGWKFQKIRSWTEDTRARMYVSTVKPGKHERTASRDGPLEVGERESIQCPRRGALVGATESTGIVYCYINNQWPYVWVSN